MKRLLLLSFSLFIVFSCFAQKPNWITEKMNPKNETYLFMCESGYGDEELKARSAAISRVVNMTRLRLGQEYDMDAIKKTLDNYNLDLNKAKERIFELTKGQVSVQEGYYDWSDKRYWVLCAVQKTMKQPMNLDETTMGESVPSLALETQEMVKPLDNTNGETAVTERPKTPKTPKEVQKPGQNKPKQTSMQRRPVKKQKIWWHSAIVPGLAQIQKGATAEGVATLAGEVALICGGAYSHFHAKNQLDIMNQSQVPSEFNTAVKSYNMDKVINLSCYAGAAVLYVFNLYRAYTMDSRPYYYAVTPTMMSYDGELAMGLSFTYNF